MSRVVLGKGTSQHVEKDLERSSLEQSHSILPDRNGRSSRRMAGMAKFVFDSFELDQVAGLSKLGLRG